MPAKLELVPVGDGLSFAGVDGEVSFTVLEVPIDALKARRDRELYVASIARTFAEKCQPGVLVARGAPGDDGVSTKFRLACTDGSTSTGYVLQSPEAVRADALLFHALVVRGKNIDALAAVFVNSFRVHSPARNAMGTPAKALPPKPGVPTNPGVR